MLFLGDIGGGEMLLIMLVILLFFGSKNIPQLARGLGKGIREFRDAASGIQREIEKSMYEDPTASAHKKVEPKPTPLPEVADAKTEDAPEVHEPPVVISPAEGTVSRIE